MLMMLSTECDTNFFAKGKSVIAYFSGYVFFERFIAEYVSPKQAIKTTPKQPW